MTMLQSVTSEQYAIRSSIVPDETPWFAVRTRSRFEKKIIIDLQEKRIQAYVPLHSVKRQWRDRKQLVSSPLFPGYAFVRIPPTQDARVTVLRTNGVVSFVGSRGMGTPIPDAEIYAVQTILTRQIPFVPYPYLQAGQRVRIRGGCFEQMEGILVAVNGDQSLIVSIELIQRSIAIRLAGYVVEPM